MKEATFHLTLEVNFLRGGLDPGLTERQMKNRYFNIHVLTKITLLVWHVTLQLNCNFPPSSNNISPIKNNNFKVHISDWGK